MRGFPAAAVLLALAAIPAAALEVVSPPVLAHAGLAEQAAAFGQAHGDKVTVRAVELLKVAQTARGAPTDVVFATPDILKGMGADIVSAGIAPVGRVNIVLAVPRGGPHPDISTVEKLAAVLRGARGVVYSNPDPARGSLGAAIIDRMLRRPEFSGVRRVISSKGNGASGLINGEGDMALQFESEILPHKELEVVAALPAGLGAHVDISAAVMARAADPAQARAFIASILRPEAAGVWKAHGLVPASAP